MILNPANRQPALFWHLWQASGMYRARPWVSWTLTAACLLAGCSRSPEVLRFPADFWWGTATAGFQVEMGCPTLSAAQCNDEGSDWYAFATDPQTVGDEATFLSGDSPTDGPGHWELYDADYERAAQDLGTNTFRFGFEWSRIFPTATDGVEGYDNLLAIADASAIAHYHEMIGAMRAHGLEPMATVNHYTLPSWLHDGVGCHLDLATCSPRGWVDDTRTITEITKLAGFLAVEFGDDIDLWVTLNEPFVVVLSGYLLPDEGRTNPPAVTAPASDSRAVLLALIEAHARMYDAIKAADTTDANGDGISAWVGNAHAGISTVPADASSALDRTAAQNVFYLWNSVFLDATVLGQFDEDLDGIAEYRADLEGRMDFIGINYYFGVFVEGIASPILPELSVLTTFNPFTLDLDSDYLRGIYDLLLDMDERYGLPILITENGYPDPGDDLGPRHVTTSLTWVARAIRDGADVRGFYYWSLMDNYEWNHGYDLRFGLYEVDFTDPARPRTPRAAVDVYSQIVTGGEIPPGLRKQYPGF